ncbi:alpha-tocopherol transfer protein-like [Toxorhynchites rutilus septentrionalis]|uniref:alpha-tocopherol transfer protein-like n=1 Tax=Toxorhynchites rutilus septentrionalis TaxID=329112 RepID=UPI00247866CE|nr:alpha-tocopherol transfer protein-like [Toxorhynchites rutilus septentrionalis]
MRTVSFAKVEDMYARFEDLKKEDVDELDKWVIEQPHLPSVSEMELIQFIHSNYFDMDAAKRTIEAYFTFRTNCKEFFSDKDVLAPALQRTMDVIAISLLPENTEEGYKVLFAKVIDSDASKFSLSAILKLAFVCVDILLWQEGCAEGNVLIIDMNGIHLGHLPKLSIFTLKNFLYYIQEALPIRLKGVHLINVVPFIDRIMMMIKPFLKKELLEMFHIHKREESLYPFVPRRMLSCEYSGNAPTIMALKKQLYDNVIEYRSLILEKESLQKVDETKRIKTRTLSNMFGLF